MARPNTFADPRSKRNWPARRRLSANVERRRKDGRRSAQHPRSSCRLDPRQVDLVVAGSKPVVAVSCNAAWQWAQQTGRAITVSSGFAASARPPPARPKRSFVERNSATPLDLRLRADPDQCVLLVSATRSAATQRRSLPELESQRPWSRQEHFNAPDYPSCCQIRPSQRSERRLRSSMRTRLARPGAGSGEFGARAPCVTIASASGCAAEQSDADPAGGFDNQSDASEVVNSARASTLPSISQ